MQIVISSIIIAASIALFAYWFRYSCLLILSTQTTQDYTEEVAITSRLSVLEIQSRLEAGQSMPLHSALQAMEADFALVNRLLERVPGVEEHLSAAEQMLLRLDYRIMSLWARVTEKINPAQARQALLEQCAIISHFANAAGCAGGARG